MLLFCFWNGCSSVVEEGCRVIILFYLFIYLGGKRCREPGAKGVDRLHTWYVFAVLRVLLQTRSPTWHVGKAACTFGGAYGWTVASPHPLSAPGRLCARLGVHPTLAAQNGVAVNALRIGGQRH